MARMQAEHRGSVLPDHKFSHIPDTEAVLTGILVKKNRYYMKQERRFELYKNGELKYFHNQEQKGVMKLSKGSKARKISRTEVEI